MKEHTVSKEDIDALFGGKLQILNEREVNSKEKKSTRNTVSLDGARVLVEGLAKMIPKITVETDEPEELEEGGIYLQYD